MAQALETYKALADESRLRLVHILSRGAFNVQELTSILELGQSTISHHLRILQNAGLTRRSKQGTWTYYQLVNGDGSQTAKHLIQSCLGLKEIEEDQILGHRLNADQERVVSVLNTRRETAQRFFETVGGKWRDVRPTIANEEQIIEQVAKQISPNDSLLELGCGSGQLLEKILPRKGATIAVDYSTAMLDEARKHLGEAAQAVDFRLGYLEHLPLADNSVERAVAYMVFHHLAEPKEVLREVARVLKPGGTLQIADLVAHDREEMRQQFGDLWLGFSPEEFSSWLVGAGFKNPAVSLVGKKKEVFLLLTHK